MKRSLAFRSATAVFAAGLVFLSARAADDTAAVESDELASLPGHFRRALARELELTTEQRHALKEVMRMHQPMLRPLLEQARIEREALRALIAAPTLDENALSAQADRIAATHKQIVIASAHTHADLRKILTADQRAKLEGWRAHAQDRATSGRAQFREWLLQP